MNLTQLLEEEFSPVWLLPDTNETIVKELSEPIPYRVTGEAFIIDVELDYTRIDGR